MRIGRTSLSWNRIVFEDVEASGLSPPSGTSDVRSKVAPAPATPLSAFATVTTPASEDTDSTRATRRPRIVSFDVFRSVTSAVAVWDFASQERSLRSTATLPETSTSAASAGLPFFETVPATATGAV